MKRYESFGEFYPFYLTQHSHPACRFLHVLGTGIALAWGLGAFISGAFAWMPLSLPLGYGFSWIGHYGFERNRPAAFSHPLYSLLGDFRMFFEVVGGRRTLRS